MRIATLLFVAGCFHPDPMPGLACAPDRWCPPPQMCGSDGLCHAGGTIDGSIDIDAAQPANYAFVTSDKTTIASYADLQALDTHCSNLASAQGKAGTYVAWFSTPTMNAIDRVAGHAGWIRPDLETFARSTTDITSGTLYYPLRIDEMGVDQGEDLVATATDSDGTYTFGATCFNNGTGNADYGFANATTHWWTTAGNPSTVDCARPIRFYCFEIDNRPAAPMPAHVGRHAFQSNGVIDGGMSRAQMDAKCQAEAPLATTSIALVASNGSDALSRVSIGAPLVRPDGVVFMTGDTHVIIAPLNVTPGLMYQDVPVWAGASTASSPPADATDDCNDWSDGTSSMTGREGSSAQTSEAGFGLGGKTSCSLNLHLYCIEP